jgi:hypothetical protein
MFVFLVILVLDPMRARIAYRPPLLVMVRLDRVEPDHDAQL